MTPKKMNLILWTILSVAILAIAGGLYFADVVLSGLASDTAHLKAESEINRERQSVYGKNKINLEKLSGVQELADEIIPKTQDQSVIVSEIAAFAAQSGVGMGGIAFEQPAATTGRKTAEQKAQEKLIPKGTTLVPLTIDLAQGSAYNNVIRFLDIIENNRRKMQITNVTMVPSTDNRSLLDQVTLKLNLYAKAEAKSTATTGGAK